MALKAFYPGSFDPITLGHVDIIKRAGGFVDQLIVGVGVHDGKQAMLGAQVRVDLINKVKNGFTRPLSEKVRVVEFSSLAVECARQHGCNVIIRGLRDATDYAYEVQMAGMNGMMAPGIETIFLASSGPVRHIASNLVRQINALEGDISEFVPKEVAAYLQTLDNNTHD